MFVIIKASFSSLNCLVNLTSFLAIYVYSLWFSKTESHPIYLATDTDFEPKWNYLKTLFKFGGSSF